MNRRILMIPCLALCWAIGCGGGGSASSSGQLGGNNSGTGAAANSSGTPGTPGSGGSGSSAPPGSGGGSAEPLPPVTQGFVGKIEGTLTDGFVRSKVPKNIEVIIGESGPDWLTASKALYDAVDVVMWHVHPWWQQVAIDQAAQFTATTHAQILARMKELGVSKPERLGETGFPWGQCNGPTCGTEASQAQYLHDLNQYSLQSGLEYWFFEGFDEVWKGAEGGVGAKWGMWNDMRQPHPVIANIATEILPQEMWP